MLKLKLQYFGHLMRRTDAKNWLIGKDPYAGKDWRREEKGMIGDETLSPWKKSYDQPREHIKNQRHYFANKGPSGQSYAFSSSHVWMCELGYKESWVLKNWCFWTVVLGKTLESPLDCKEIQPVHPEGNRSWMFIGKTDPEAPILGCLMWKADSL